MIALLGVAASVGISLFSAACALALPVYLEVIGHLA